jgi:hypothetical protein
VREIASETGAELALHGPDRAFVIVAEVWPTPSGTPRISICIAYLALPQLRPTEIERSVVYEPRARESAQLSGYFATVCGTSCGLLMALSTVAGISVCPMAETFASGRCAPDEPLPTVDGYPKHDFSKMIARHTAKSLRVAARQDGR